jgi:hypothetical protein
MEFVGIIFTAGFAMISTTALMERLYREKDYWMPIEFADAFLVTFAGLYYFRWIIQDRITATTSSYNNEASLAQFIYIIHVVNAATMRIRCNMPILETDVLLFITGQAFVLGLNFMGGNMFLRVFCLHFCIADWIQSCLMFLKLCGRSISNHAQIIMMSHQVLLILPSIMYIWVNRTISTEIILFGVAMAVSVKPFVEFRLANNHMLKSENAFAINEVLTRFMKQTDGALRIEETAANDEEVHVAPSPTPAPAPDVIDVDESDFDSSDDYDDPAETYDENADDIMAEVLQKTVTPLPNTEIKREPVRALDVEVSSDSEIEPSKQTSDSELSTLSPSENSEPIKEQEVKVAVVEAVESVVTEEVIHTRPVRSKSASKRQNKTTRDNARITPHPVVPREVS